MIKLSNLAKHIEKLLNDEAEKQPLFNTERIKTEFVVTLDTADYKQAHKDIENPNKVINYINCLLSPAGSSVEGTEKISATINTTLSMVTKIYPGTYGKSEFIEALRNVIDNITILNSSGIITDENDNIYTYGMNCSLAIPENREIRAWVGDSISFNAFINWYIIESGVNSTNIELTIDEKPVYFTTFSQTRGGQMESYVQSSTKSGTAQNMETATAVAITFTVPMRSDDVSQYINKYLDSGENPERGVMKTIEYPNGEKSTAIWSMKFSEVALSGEINKNGLLQVTMTNGSKW